MGVIVPLPQHEDRQQHHTEREGAHDRDRAPPARRPLDDAEQQRDQAHGRQQGAEHVESRGVLVTRHHRVRRGALELAARGRDAFPQRPEDSEPLLVRRLICLLRRHFAECDLVGDVPGRRQFTPASGNLNFSNSRSPLCVCASWQL